MEQCMHQQQPGNESSAGCGECDVMAASAQAAHLPWPASGCIWLHVAFTTMSQHGYVLSQVDEQA